MFGLPELVTIGLISFFAAFVVFMLMNPQKAKSMLSHDGWGLLVFAFVVLLLVALFYLQPAGSWVVAVVALGSFIAGCGLLIGLPDPLTDLIITRQNLGYVLIIAGLTIGVYYTIAPSWKFVVQAFDIVWKNTKLSQVLVFVGAVVMVIVGTMFITEKRSL